MKKHMIDYFFLQKVLNNKEIRLAKSGDQNKYSAHGIFDKSRKFNVIMNCKGHKKVRLSLMMNSNEGNMMRLDIIGKPHQGFPTPHLHIFNNDDIFSSEFLRSEKLPEPLNEVLINLYDFRNNLKLFFVYNNIELQGVTFHDSLDKEEHNA